MADLADLLAAQGAGSLLEGLTPVHDTRGLASEPSQFRQFLEQIGYGTLTSGSLCIYSGTIEPNEVFGPTWSGPSVRLFADDMAGTCFGFLPAGQVVRLEASGAVGGVVAENFFVFMQKRLARLVR